MIIPMLSPDAFAKMELSVANECQGLDELKTGVSVVLWRLRELLKGYRYALDHGYSSGVHYEEREERETNP